MSIFFVWSRSMLLPGPPKKRRTPMQRRWYTVLQYMQSVFIFGGLFGLTFALVHSLVLFILLPVGVSLIVRLFTSRSHPYNRKTLFLTAGLALIYFSAVTGWELLTHSPSTPEIIVVTTTLAAAVIFEPAHTFAQAFLEQRLHLLDDETGKIIEAFTSALREEIDLSGVRERFLDVLQQTMQPQRVSLWLRATPDPIDATDAPAPQYSPTTASRVEIAEGDPFLTYALEHPGALDVEQLQLDSQLIRTLKNDEAEIVISLVGEGELLGLLALGSRLNDQEYGREERRLLGTLASQVSSALRVAYMVLAQQTQVRERERIEQELRTAQTIQRTFLPKEIPAVPGWQIRSYYQPAREVGGDFYDMLPFKDGRIGFVIGDVTGKGIPAALVMTATRTMLRTAAQENTSPAAIFARVNDLLHTDIPSGMFATCFYALLDPTTGRLQFANAGQDLPYVRNADGRVGELRATGMPLGLMPGSQYDEGEVTLTPGDCLLFYSDGLVEAHNPQREMFGLPRVMNLVKEQDDTTTLIDALLDNLRQFTGTGWEQEDDVTLVALLWEHNSSEDMIGTSATVGSIHE